MTRGFVFSQVFLLSQAQLAVEHHKEADQLGKHTVNDGNDQEHEIHTQERAEQCEKCGFHAVFMDFLPFLQWPILSLQETVETELLQVLPV